MSNNDDDSETLAYRQKKHKPLANIQDIIK